MLAQLRGEFPDVSVSKIRFLESEGLIQPARSPSGYRRFGPADVARLRYILTAQRDQYLPLRVIKDRLAAADGDAGADLEGPGRRGGRAAAEPPGAARRGRDRRQLPGRTGRFRPGPRRRPAVRPDALAAARIIVALGRYGVQARHLRAVRAAVERETALIEQVVAPTLRQRSPGSRDRAGQTARELAALSLQLHASLMGSALAEAGLDVAGLLGGPAAGDRAGPRAEPDRAAGGYAGNGFAGPAAAGSGA